MDKPDAWMPLYIPDYLRDTSRLTRSGHGAYMLLLMDYWVNGPPPDDNAVLATITRSTAREWTALRPHIEGFFQIRDGRWHQKRADAERKRAANITAQRRLAASKRWAGKDANASAADDANAEQSRSPPPPPLQIDDDEEARARDPKREVLEAIGVWNDARWLGNGGLVEAWMAAGCDLDRDILPTVKAVMAKRGSQDPPSSLKYFDRPVMDAMATRTTPPRPGKSNGNAGQSNRSDQTALRRSGLARAFADDAPG